MSDVKSTTLHAALESHDSDVWLFRGCPWEPTVYHYSRDGREARMMIPFHGKPVSPPDLLAGLPPVAMSRGHDILDWHSRAHEPLPTIYEDETDQVEQKVALAVAASESPTGCRYMVFKHDRKDEMTIVHGDPDLPTATRVRVSFPDEWFFTHSIRLVKNKLWVTLPDRIVNVDPATGNVDARILRDKKKEPVFSTPIFMSSGHLIYISKVMHRDGGWERCYIHDPLLRVACYFQSRIGPFNDLRFYAVPGFLVVLYTATPHNEDPPTIYACWLSDDVLTAALRAAAMNPMRLTRETHASGRIPRVEMEEIRLGKFGKEGGAFFTVRGGQSE